MNKVMAETKSGMETQYMFWRKYNFAIWLEIRCLVNQCNLVIAPLSMQLVIVSTFNEYWLLMLSNVKEEVKLSKGSSALIKDVFRFK